MARAAAQAFSWHQFRVMLRVIVRGEKTVDNTGMGLGDDGAPKRRGLAGKIGSGARKVAMALLFLLLVVMFFMLGVGLHLMGVSPYAAFSLAVVALVTMTVLTGLYQAVNVLYFVRDLSYYLTLPISTTSVMWAKLAHFLAVSVAGDLIFAPVALGCLWAEGSGIAACAVALLAYVLCAVAVDLALVIVCVPLMRFSRLAHDKDRFSRLFGGLIIVLALCVGAGSQFALNGDGLASLAGGAEDLLGAGPAAVVLALLCPPTLVARQVVSGAPLEVALGLFAMVALVVLYAAVLSLIAGRWYFEGVQSVQDAGAKRGRVVKGSELVRATSSRGSFATNLARDWKMMVRVPVFFNQFVLSSLLMPLYFVVIMIVSGAMGVSSAEDAGVGVSELLEMVRLLCGSLSFSEVPLVWVAVGVLGFSVLLGFSSYSYTMAVSRDGEDFFFLRALPMDWRGYLMAKLTSPYLLSNVPMLVLMAVALVVCGVPVAVGLYLVVLYLAATGALALLSLGMGGLFPRLDWDNEAQLVKGGGATLMVFAGVVVGVVVVLIPALALLGSAQWGVIEPAVSLALALVVLALECAGLTWWVLFPVARSLSRRER